MLAELMRNRQACSLQGSPQLFGVIVYILFGGIVYMFLEALVEITMVSSTPRNKKRIATNLLPGLLAILLRRSPEAGARLIIQ